METGSDKLHFAIQHHVRQQKRQVKTLLMEPISNTVSPFGTRGSSVVEVAVADDLARLLGDDANDNAVALVLDVDALHQHVVNFIRSGQAAAERLGAAQVEQTDDGR